MCENDTKICSKCKELKSIQQFYNSKSECKVCIKESRRIYRLNNKEKIKQRYIAYRDKNKDSINKRISEYRKSNPEKRRAYYEKNREKLIAINKASYEKYRDVNIQKRKKWYQNNKEKHAADRTEYELKNKDRLRAARRKWENNKLRTDCAYKLHKNIAGRIRFELKGVSKKSDKTEEIIGCTITELKIFIENQFSDGMTWDNWGINGWHIDHRIPLSWFNLENENCRKMAFNYKNMQPLWSEENLKKKNYYSHKLAS